MSGFYDITNLQRGSLILGSFTLDLNKKETIYLTDEEEKSLASFNVLMVPNLSATSAINMQGKRIQRDIDTNDTIGVNGKLELLTADKTLTVADSGKVFRSDSGSAIAVTVPAGLPELFNVGLMRWGAGALTIVECAGATNRSALTAISAQYKMASILVAKNNAALTAAEFTAGEV